MQVTIYYFAVLRELRALEQERLDIDEGCSVLQLYHQLFPPDQQPAPPPVLFVVDEEYVSADTPLHDGAEVAFIPPLGGG